MNQGHLIGQLGESLAHLYLLSKKHSIVSRNFVAHHGEIDIISLCSKIIHISEVKSSRMDISISELEEVSYETRINLKFVLRHKIRETIRTFLSGELSLEMLGWGIWVSHETSTESLDLVGRVSPAKINSINSTINYFLLMHPEYSEFSLQIDIIEVLLDPRKKVCIIRCTEQVIAG